MQLEGYAKISDLMSRHDEFAIFRRFSNLNFLNVLYLQAELSHLEEDLRAIVQADKTDPDRIYYTKHWYSLAHSENDDDKEQWEKFSQIREKLLEYNTHLLHLSQLTHLPPPKKHDLSFLRKWLMRPSMGNFPLLGPDSASWSAPYTHDLLALHRRSSSDPFTHFCLNILFPFLNRHSPFRIFRPSVFPPPPPLPPASSTGEEENEEAREKEPESLISHFPDQTARALVNALGTVLASVLPIASIVVLFFVQTQILRLGLTVLFTVLFAACLAGLTRARRVEIFAATSAFAAVQVVFMTGGNITQSSNS